MYHTERNPLKKLHRENGEVVGAVRNGRQRKLHKAFLRYHDPANWPLLREALKEMGRSDLIGNGKKQLIPAWQPAGVPVKPCSLAKAAPSKAAGQPRGGQRAQPQPGRGQPRGAMPGQAPRPRPGAPSAPKRGPVPRKPR